MSTNYFFGLVRKNGINPSANMVGPSGEPEYELYLVNDSNNSIVLKRRSFGGFKTFDDSTAEIESQDSETDITIEPHSFILYCEMYEDSFDGAGQYRAFIKTVDGVKTLEFYTSRGVGFLGSLIPCVNKYGRVIKPIIRD